MMIHKEPSRLTRWIKRPVFRQGQRLTDERLNKVYANHAARLRRTVLGIAGPGIVHGFAIQTNESGECEVKDGKIHIGCGLAFDRHGRELLWPGDWVSVRDLAGDQPAKEGEHTLRVHYAERRADAHHDHGCCASPADCIEEGIVFTLECDCKPTCHGCPENRHDCACSNEYICSRAGSDEGGVDADEDLALVCVEPCDLDRANCDDRWYDPAAGLDLACVSICNVNRDDAGCELRYVFCAEQPKVCNHRRYVYRNPLLFELLQGCHLKPTRVESVNFVEWLDTGWGAAVGWSDFWDKLDLEGLKVWFTKRVATKTLHASSIFVTAILREQESFSQDVLRLPVVAMDSIDPVGELASGVTLRFRPDWISAQKASDLSRFCRGFTIEVTVRGSLLRDECDCLVDGRPLNFDHKECAQAMPGGDFVVGFRVLAKGESAPCDKTPGPIVE